MGMRKRIRNPAPESGIMKYSLHYKGRRYQVAVDNPMSSKESVYHIGRYVKRSRRGLFG